MRLTLKDCTAIPWSNGGGLTRELAAKRVGGRIAWRLSVAEIERDGPFSTFPGMARIHTVMAGQGLDLLGRGAVLQARPFQPLAFDGSLELQARLLEGACQAFNVIYNPQLVSVGVTVWDGHQSLQVAAGAIVFVVSGTVATDAGDRFTALEGAILQHDALFETSPGARMFCVHLKDNDALQL